MNAAQKMPLRRKLVYLMIAGIAGGMVPLGAMAQDAAWPTRMVRIVVPAPSGGSDTLARLLAPKLEAIWKQTVIVEPKPGAGGMVGTEYVANSGDDHAILIGTQSSLLPKYTRKDVRYDALTDIVPVYKLMNYPTFLVTNPATAAKAKTLKDFIALSKSTDNGLFYAGNSPTAIYNLTTALVNQHLGIRYSAVNYNSISDVTIAVIRNDAQLLTSVPGTIKPYIDDGKVVPLAVIAPERYAGMPDIPTIREAAGYDGYYPVLWSGFFSPKGTSPAVAEKIAKDTATVLQDPEIRERMETALGGDVLASSPAQFKAEYLEEAKVWEKLIQDLKIDPQ